MDYLKLLPQNVHEEILSKFDIDEPFDLKISEDFNGLGLSFSRKKSVSQNIIQKYKKFSSYNRRYSLIRSLDEDKIIFHITSFFFENNIFFGIYDGYCNDEHQGGLVRKNILFEGKNKVYFENISINISNKAKNLLINKIKGISCCSNHKNCKNTDKNSSWFQFIDCSSCNKKLQPTHYNCIFKCHLNMLYFKTGKEYVGDHFMCCKDCSRYCEECNNIYCAEHVVYCNECGNNVCYDKCSTECQKCSNIICLKHRSFHNCKN